MDTFRTYYRLTKPGIIYGNAVPAIGAFFLASHGAPDYGALVLMLLGLSFVVASGCVFNNYIDRDIDAVMERTKSRAFVTGAVEDVPARIYAVALGLLGFSILCVFANALTAIIAAFGFVVYVFAYSLAAKRGSVYGTHVGALAGATPPVVGYVAASGRLDVAALVLFLMLVAWQMPHFFAIVLRRESDYRAARIPALPLVRSERESSLQTLGYIVAYTIAASLLYVLAYAGIGYLAVVIALGIGWFALAAIGRSPRSVFLASLIVLVGTCVAMALDAL